MKNIHNIKLSGKYDFKEKQKYLNSSFLNTACHMKVPGEKPEISYLYYDETPDTLGVKMGKSELKCETLTLPKTSNDILIKILSKKLYDKYIDLANSNEQNLKDTTIRPKLNLLNRWLKKDYDLLLENTHEGHRKLFSKILMYSSHIAAKYRAGAASFIIVNQKIAQYLTSSPHFKFNQDTSLVYFKTILHEDIISLGSVADIEVFVNYKQKEDSILIGRHTTDVKTIGGVFILENKTEINDKSIEWTGTIDYASPYTKYMFDLIKIKPVNDLPWLKRQVFKFLKKKNLING